jgi:hypothetical protein
MSISHRTFSCTVVAALLLATAQQLPAPISEIESPTPTPERSAKPKLRLAPKPKPKPEASAAATNSVTQQTGKHSRFAGTWVGTMPIVPYGDVAIEFDIDKTETTVIGKSRLGTEVVKARIDGGTLQANLRLSTWWITPEPGGKTAIVRIKAQMNDQTAVFHRAAE